MSDSLDLRSANKEPFIINNQIYVLGNPTIQAQTLEQLIYVLDQLGAEQPVVIINPQANTVPDFDQKLSQLIQNNRRTQPQNRTTADKYRFKDLGDAELRSMAESTCQQNPVLDLDNMLDMYLGLRARAQALYALDQLCQERDSLWAAHCANPASPEGAGRYLELQSQLIPQAQQNYEGICLRLQEMDSQQVKESKRVVSKTIEEKPVQQQQSSVLESNTSTLPTAAIVSANTTEREDVSDSGLIFVTGVSSSVPLWGPWRSPRYMKMPLNLAKNLASSPTYAGLREQQRDVEFDGRRYKAVEPEYLLSLGIDLVADGLPIVYTDIGTFKRVGYSNEPLNNLKYWYPRPKFLD